MSIYIPPVPHAPAHRAPGAQPLTVEVLATSDPDLVFDAQFADAVAVLMPDAAPVPPAGKALGDYLARINAKGFDPELADRGVAIWVPKLTYLRQVLVEHECRFVLSARHAFADLCGLSVLVVALAPEPRDAVTITAGLQVSSLFK